jgi:hypothetical protein
MARLGLQRSAACTILRGNLAYRDGDTWNDITSQHGLMSIGAVALGPGGSGTVALQVVAAATNLGLGVYQGGGRL